MDYAAELGRENRALGEVCAAADPELPVSSCPGWSVHKLLAHVGRGDRWAATIVREQRQEQLLLRDVADGRPPAELPSAVEWLHGGADALIDAVAVDPAVSVWTFLGQRPGSWWLRRRLQENLIHRADATLAVGGRFVVDADLAADCLQEFLDLFVAFGDVQPLADGATLLLTATDTGASWLLRGTASSFAVSSGGGPADTQVAAPLAELLLAVYRRVAADDPRLAVSGDAASWQRLWETLSF